MILIAYRHGMRVSELVGLRREQVDLSLGLLHVRRRKNGLPSTHPARSGNSSPASAGLGMPIHPHMLRHSTGFKLANDGQDTRAIQHYLGHRNIQHTVVYTHLASERFNDFWDD